MILKMYSKQKNNRSSETAETLPEADQSKAFNILQGAMCRRKGSNFKRSFSLNGVNVDPNSRSKRKAPASPRTRPLLHRRVKLASPSTSSRKGKGNGTAKALQSQPTHRGGSSLSRTMAKPSAGKKAKKVNGKMLGYAQYNC